VTDRPDRPGDPPGSPHAGPAGGGPGRASGSGPGSADDSRAEVVLSQALRAMAGGREAASGAPSGSSGADATGGRSRRTLTTGQLVLLAAIVGLLVGIGAGLLSLLL